MYLVMMPGHLSELSQLLGKSSVQGCEVCGGQIENRFEFGGRVVIPN